MPGFGSGSFGSGPFGSFDWSKQVLWRDLPDIDRALDEGENNRLRKWTDSVGDVLDLIARSASDLYKLRDPLDARSRNTNVISNNVASSIKIDSKTQRVTLSASIERDVHAGWTLEDSSGAIFNIEYVHSDEGYVDVSPSNVPVAAGSCTLRGPSELGYLASDFGISIDRNDSEKNQRSSVRFAWAWLASKGAEVAYRVAGDWSDYYVTPIRLWKVSDDVAASLDPAHVFEFDGVKYTDLEPRFPVYDEVAADFFPADTSCSDIGLIEDGPFTVSSVTQIGPGKFRVHLSTKPERVGSGNNWSAAFSPSGLSLVLESDVYAYGAGWAFEVYSESATTSDLSGTVTLSYGCQVVTSCSYCAASAIRVEMTPKPGASSVDVLRRLIRRIDGIVPVHIRVADLAHIYRASTSTGLFTSIKVSLSAEANRAIAALGRYIDIQDADSVPVDTGLVITNVQSYEL